MAIGLIRGSADIPLSPDGRQQIDELGIKFRRKGGFDSLYSSSLLRDVETSDGLMRHNPKAKFKGLTQGLQTQSLGVEEGKPETKKQLALIRSMIIDYPNRKFPDGGLASRPSESFNDFKNRVFKWAKPRLAAQIKDPSREVWNTHHRVIKLFWGWKAAGFPDDFKVDTKEVVKPDKGPGEVYRLWHDDRGWHMDSVDMDSMDKIGNGIYLVRHGLTPWNEESQGDIKE